MKKPHIKIRKNYAGRWYLWPDAGDDIGTTDKAATYCSRVNPGGYPTPGDAARALFAAGGDTCARS